VEKKSLGTAVTLYCLSSQVLECLLEHKAAVSMKCHKALFHIEQQDLGDSSSDYALLSTCKPMIKFYCYDEEPAKTLTCLKR
jgi:Cysteine rich repeat.